MSIFDRALHIPTEGGFFGPPPRALERVLLPLEARPSWRLYIIAAISALLSAACLVLGIAVLFTPVADDWSEVLFKVVGAMVFVAVAFVPAAVVATAVGDWRHRAACLVVDGEGVRDRRLGVELLSWSRIERAELVSSGSGPCAVRLRLTTDGPSLYNPCRAGGWSANWSGRRRERVIALLLLDRRPHLIAQTILALAARNGVPVEQPSRSTAVGAEQVRSPWQ